MHNVMMLFEPTFYYFRNTELFEVGVVYHIEKKPVENSDLFSS